MKINDEGRILWVNILILRPSLKARRRRSRRRRRRLRKGKCANDELELKKKKIRNAEQKNRQMKRK